MPLLIGLMRLLAMFAIGAGLVFVLGGSAMAVWAIIGGVAYFWWDFKNAPGDDGSWL